jgi:pyruvate kinase
MKNSSVPRAATVARALGKIEKQYTNLATKDKLLAKWGIHEVHSLSAINLLQYLLLRSKDISRLQLDLHNLGLSSLASSESHMHRQIQEILMRLGCPLDKKILSRCTHIYGQQTMHRRASSLFGSHTASATAFMVTLDARFSNDLLMMENLLLHGMTVARINCAHDGMATWQYMIHQVQRASQKTGKPCLIYMDLPGPKFRVVLPGKGKKSGKLPIAKGETLWYVEKGATGHVDGKLISSSIEGMVPVMKPGNVLLIDDGLVECEVMENNGTAAKLQVTRISGKASIKTGKGINFPNMTIPVDALTPDDLAILDFVKSHAHLVGYSFVRTPADLKDLQAKLYTANHQHKPYIIIKIETPEAVENLPGLLLQGMTQPNFGVMIARGDLAVEIGFERMGEIQEEIMWICEAAHTPVIWATQVLESLNKTGIASRGEITDAYKAAQAECVMVNKGAHTEVVLDTLADLMRRSKRHHLKKRYAMAALGIASRFVQKNKL